jgi:hypothetical protein
MWLYCTSSISILTPSCQLTVALLLLNLLLLAPAATSATWASFVRTKEAFDAALPLAAAAQAAAVHRRLITNGSFLQCAYTGPLGSWGPRSWLSTHHSSSGGGKRAGPPHHVKGGGEEQDCQYQRAKYGGADGHDGNGGNGDQPTEMTVESVLSSTTLVGASDAFNKQTATKSDSPPPNNSGAFACNFGTKSDALHTSRIHAHAHTDTRTRARAHTHAHAHTHASI